MIAATHLDIVIPDTVIALYSGCNFASCYKLFTLSISWSSRELVVLRTSGGLGPVSEPIIMTSLHLSSHDVSHILVTWCWRTTSNTCLVTTKTTPKMDVLFPVVCIQRIPSNVTEILLYVSYVCISFICIDTFPYYLHSLPAKRSPTREPLYPWSWLRHWRTCKLRRFLIWCLRHVRVPRETN